MNKFKIVPFLLVVFSRLVSAGGVYDAAADEARLADYQGKISRTAEALGVSVYEDFPVYAGSSQTGQRSAGFTAVKAAPQAALPLPALPASPFRMPEGMTLPEPAPMLSRGNAVNILSAIRAQLGDLGLPFTNPAPSFEVVSNRVSAAALKSSFEPRKLGQPSLFTEAGFISEFEAATGAKFISGNSVRFLVDGEAFVVKDELIKKAKKSLLISTWAFYDDITGYQTAQLLIAKKKEGVDVKIILDNKIAYTHGPKVVKMMQDAGIEIIRYSDSERGGDYWHVKMMIADDKYAIVGGMNFGDTYSHRDPNFFKWRDTDAVYSGPAALESRAIFARIWNDKVKEMKLLFKSVDPGSDNRDFESGPARISIMLQDPPKDSPILISIVKAMYGATKTINIENAYVVALPVVTKAVLDARERGVAVNLFTNSADSIDPEGKPIVDAMAKSLIPFVQAGVKVYLKQGRMDTLHSKFMVVDGLYVSIGSYNLHPRGERSDTELNLNIIDKDAAGRLDAQFQRDMDAAQKINSASELETTPGMLSRMMSRYFYATLSPK